MKTDEARAALDRIWPILNEEEKLKTVEYAFAALEKMKASLYMNAASYRQPPKREAVPTNTMLGLTPRKPNTVKGRFELRGYIYPSLKQACREFGIQYETAKTMFLAGHDPENIFPRQRGN